MTNADKPTAPGRHQLAHLASIAVPIVIYGLMPQLHRARTRLAERG